MPVKKKTTKKAAPKKKVVAKKETATKKTVKKKAVNVRRRRAIRRNRELSNAITKMLNSALMVHVLFPTHKNLADVMWSEVTYGENQARSLHFLDQFRYQVENAATFIPILLEDIESCYDQVKKHTSK